ncbi:YybH family protein [Lysinibacillus fusiformis]|uniref:YybH family protein n=1 Tax=Lysinibacillus fusiformis TaxID=28031 RepID=UPI00215A2302|nr:nuclear transport factor 2 family protein [Lysinibacillus fusiformis]MCR8853779.1 nuclear transport factor 2 family protein [Lysinibacillus fusiformis]WKT76256.1 nuclear transport factor 2 family protein [Lysinibacillus fusiformis]WKT79814.1 nuclear transport factor 2 family protein [Lysinibacillus fusiformis]
MTHEQALERYIQATNTHDFNEVKVILHPQAVYWFSDKTCTTTEEIGAYFNHAWNVIQEEVYSATDIIWLTVDEKTATCLYTYHYEGHHNGEFVSGSGRATNIFTLMNGEWKLIHEHLSGNIK